MSKIISELLGAGEPMFSIGVRQLENASGNMGVDVQLMADIIAHRNAACKALGLDPADTNGPELYQALLNIVKLHDGFLAKRLGANDVEDVADILNRIRIAAQNVKVPRAVWAVKPSVLKRLVKNANPKKTLKALHYRSLDSMLKREPVSRIILAARIAETHDWWAAMLRSYSTLTPQDFEQRDVEIVMLDDPHWNKLSNSYVATKHHNIISSKEAGAIGILALPMTRMSGVAIAVFPQVLHYINELRAYSSLFKFHQMRPDFGDLVMRTIAFDPEDHVSVVGHPLHWRTVHRLHGTNRDIVLPDFFEPHLSQDDLAWRHAEYALFMIEPALQFWHELGYVGAKFGTIPVSFNLMDMAANYVNKLPYGSHSAGRMRQSLWSELYVRYMGQPTIYNLTKHQLARRVEVAQPDELTSDETMFDNHSAIDEAIMNALRQPLTKRRTIKKQPTQATTKGKS